MERKAKVLLWSMVVLVMVSISATFFKTVVQQDFDVTGVWIEFPTEDSSYVWFLYDEEEYELELDTTDYDEILTAVTEEIHQPASSLSADFLDHLVSAYDEAELTPNDSESEDQLIDDNSFNNHDNG